MVAARPCRQAQRRSAACARPVRRAGPNKGRAAVAAASRRVAATGPGEGQLVVIDNYDSFTFNLVQYFGDLGEQVHVIKNDELTVEEVAALRPRGVLISPGPGRPEDSGISLEAVRGLGEQFPLFGVCMGHQCIGQAFGGSVIRAPCGLMHGKGSPVFHDNKGVFSGLSQPFTAARYHSLVIDKDNSFPGDELEVTAWTEDGTIMGVQHKTMPHIVGVQFHPESVITEDGKRFIQNFIDIMDGFNQ